MAYLDFGGEGQAGRQSSKIIFASFKQLQKKWKHAIDFGIKGNFNSKSVSNYRSAVNQHINTPGTIAIEGTYRGEKVIHYLNSKSGLNVISKPNGQFWSAWKLGKEQLKNVLSHGGLN